MKQKKKRRKARKVPKVAGKRKPRIPRKHSGQPNQLIIDTIVRQVIRVLRRERRKLKWLIAQEYLRIKKLPEKERGLLLRQINYETERLRNEFMVEAARP